MNDKDKRSEQTPAQSNPQLASAEHFDVGGDTVPGHGQRGESEGEYKKLLKLADAKGKSPLGKKAQPEVRAGLR